jgi:hypothetical protein
MEGNRKRKNKRSSVLLTQKELIKKVNTSTRNTYKYLDLLVWKGVKNNG